VLPTATFAIDRPAPGVAVVAATGSLDVYSAPDARSVLLDAINEGRYRQVVDLRAVGLIDSTGLSVIVGAAKRARAHGGALALAVDLDSRVGNALRIAGLHKAIAPAESVDGALEMLAMLAPQTSEPTAELAAPAAPSFWPPQPGDVWLACLDAQLPDPWVCPSGGKLRACGIVRAADRVWSEFGPLRLVWRDSALVTAMHSSELPDAPAAEGR